MTTANKFKLKKRAKLFTIITYTCLALFLIDVIGLIIWRNSTDVILTHAFNMGIVVILILAPIFLGLVFNMLSHAEIIRLNVYKNSIKEYLNLFSKYRRSNNTI